MFREGSTFTGQIFSIFKIKIIALTIRPLPKVSDHTLHYSFLLWLCCSRPRLLAPWTHWTFFPPWGMEHAVSCVFSSISSRVTPYPLTALLKWPLHHVAFSGTPAFLFVHFFHILQCLTHNKFTKIELYEHFVQMRPISFMSYLINSLFINVI